MGTIKLALRPWKKLPIVQWLGIFSLSLLMIGLNSVFWLSGNITTLLTKLNAEKVVTVYLESNTSSELVDSIKTQVGSSAVEAKLVDQKEFLQELEKLHPNLVKEVQALGSDADWVTPKFLTLRGDISSDAVEKIKSIIGVESVDLSEQRLLPVVQSLKTIQSVSRGFFVGFILAFFTTFFLIARLNRHVQNDSIKIIRQFGGTEFQIKLPQLLHQSLLGLIAGIISAGIWLYTQPFLSYHLGTLSPYLKDLKLQNPNIVFSEILGSILIGWISAYFISTQTPVEAAS